MLIVFHVFFRAANLLDGLNVQDFSQLNFSSLISSSALADVAANPWLNSKQLGVLVSKLKMSWGPIQRWTAQQIRKAGRSLKVLLPKDLLMLNVSAIVDQFNSLANDCGFSFSQVRSIYVYAYSLNFPDSRSLDQRFVDSFP